MYLLYCYKISIIFFQSVIILNIFISGMITPEGIHLYLHIRIFFYLFISYQEITSYDDNY